MNRPTPILEELKITIERFVDRTGTDKEDALCDLLCDLLHYADQYGYDFANELRRACDHFVAETTEP